MSLVHDFIAHEGHCDGHNATTPKWSRYIITAIVLNEIRGAIVAGSIAYQLWG